MSEIPDHFKKLEKEKQNTWGKENYKQEKNWERKDKRRKSALLFLKRYTDKPRIRLVKKKKNTLITPEIKEISTQILQTS